ncbi:MAG: hypothetical protein AAF518_05835 [Spirochaetota bacterium]
MLENEPRKWQNTFFYNFLEQLQLFSYTPEQITRYAWKPFLPEELNILGEKRDKNFAKVALTAKEVEAYLEQMPKDEIQIDRDFFRERKVAILLVPGFTHHTLRNLSLHEQMYDKNSSHHIMHFSLDTQGKEVREQIFREGDGLKLAYIAYPRANAHSRYILPSLFDLIHNAKSIRKWALEDGYRFVILGYSYGSPLALELLAKLHKKEFRDDFILSKTIGFFSLCGDIGGSYLADYVSDEASKYNVHKVLRMAKRYRFLGKILGFKTQQDYEDIAEGAFSLGHEVRQSILETFYNDMPSDIRYFSIAAFLAMSDYKNSMLRNFDDWSMYKQALASKDISIYNDGQLVLNDMLIPPFPGVAKENIVNLGAVRTHHWGVSYRTFNFGKNHFPRLPFYYALIKTLFQARIGDRPV